MNRTLLTLVLLAAAAAPCRAAGYPIVVRGGDEASLTQGVPSGKAAEDKGPYDVIIVGGGLAGLTSAVYLTDHGQRVLLLEKEEAVGGLAFGGQRQGLRYNRGAAYWTSAYEEEAKILERLGMSDYKTAHPIHEPIDSYLWNGRLYIGIWEEETLKELPACFALFKHELKHADKAKMIPNQPIEESGALGLDLLSAAQWVRSMPELTKMRQDEESKALYARFKADPELDPRDPMKHVLDFLDVFGPSALGTTTDRLSAVAFANFYISEIETRYTTSIGTGEAAQKLAGLLQAAPLAKVLVGAPVVRIEDEGAAVTVTYLYKGKKRSAKAPYAVFAAPLKAAPKLIAGLAERDPERAAQLAALQYADFSVHAVFVKGHPYRATYDTWMRDLSRKEGDPTDVILGRWMDPSIDGYEGLRDFKKDPPDDQGVLTVYHPHPLAFTGSGYTKAQASGFAEYAVSKMTAALSPMLKEKWGTSIDVRSVETSRWPYSIHIARPGHFTVLARTLRKPLGRIFFANNNIGTPAFEEALFRGHCAANNILKRQDPDFAQEPWTKCPLD